jgi:hypothetical protein
MWPAPQASARGRCNWRFTATDREREAQFSFSLPVDRLEGSLTKYEMTDSPIAATGGMEGAPTTNMPRRRRRGARASMLLGRVRVRSDSQSPEDGRFWPPPALPEPNAKGSKGAYMTRLPRRQRTAAFCAFETFPIGCQASDLNH